MRNDRTRSTVENGGATQAGMNRRDFAKNVVLLSVAVQTQFATGAERTTNLPGDFYDEPVRKVPMRRFDVVVAGGGAARVVAVRVAARQGAKTALIETKGYTGGTVVEGGTALHSFFNLWKAFPGVQKRQVVKGIPSEIVDCLTKAGGCSGHTEMIAGYNYDSVNTSVDTEIYKLLTMAMLSEAGVFMALNTMVVCAAADGPRVRGAIVESHSGRELCAAKSRGTRELPYRDLRDALANGGVYFEG